MCNNFNLEKLIVLCEKIVKDYEIDIKNRNIYEFRDFTIFLIYYYSINTDIKIQNKIKRNLKEIGNIIKNFKHNGSLWYGVSGFGLILHTIDQYYFKNEIAIAKNISINYVKKLIDYYSIDILGHRFYDMFYGLIGTGNFLLEINDSDSINTIKQIVDIFDNLADTNLSMFILKPNVYYNDGLKQDYPYGYIDLSFSHGLAGILNFLIKCEKKKICKCESIINKIQIFIKKCAKNYNGVIYWDGRYNKNITKPTEKINTSWCYGFLGICYSVYKKKNNFLLDDNIKYVMNKICHFSYDKLFFCHGLVGDFYMLLKLLDQTNYYMSYDKKKELIHIITKEVSYLYEMENESMLYENTKFSILTGLFSILIPLIKITSNCDIKIFDKFLLLE